MLVVRIPPSPKEVMFFTSEIVSPAFPASSFRNVLMLDYIALGAARAPDGAGARAEDILFGDVWLCSGQSNMDMNYNWGLTRGKEDVETKTHPRIRLFNDRNRWFTESVDG